jgi:hypothetical protein
LNLFGQPRVSIWPVRFQTSAEGGSANGTPNLPQNGLNAFDNTILFCSSVGQSTNTSPPNTESLPTSTLYPPSTGAVPYRYIFTRRELHAPGVTQSTDQLNAGYASTTYTGATSNVQDINLQRNRQLITYLQNLTGSGGDTSGANGPNYNAIPGFGNSLVGKWGVNNRDAIITEIFDYIRCGNAIDTTSMNTTAFTNGTPTGTGASGANINNGNPAQFAPQGVIMPSRVALNGGTTNPSHGMGRFPTVSEVALDFYYAGALPADATKPYGLITTDNRASAGPGTGFATIRRIRAFLIVSTFNPMQGYAPTSNPKQFDPKIGLVVKNLDQLLFTSYNSHNGQQPDILNRAIFPSSKSAVPLTYTAVDGQWIDKLYCASGQSWGGRNYGGYEGFMHTMLGLYSPTNTTATWAPQKIAMGKTAPTIPFTGPGTGTALPYPQAGIASQAGAMPPTGTSSNTYANQEFYELQSPDPNIYDPDGSKGISLVLKGKYDPVSNADLCDDSFTINGTASGKPITIDVTYGMGTNGSGGVVVQTLQLNFPATLSSVSPAQNKWPMPQGDPSGNGLQPKTKNNDPSTWVADTTLNSFMSKCYW